MEKALNICNIRKKEFVFDKSLIFSSLYFLLILFNIVLNYGFSNFGIHLGSIIVPFSQVIMLIGFLRYVLLKLKSQYFKPIELLIIILFTFFIIRVPFNFIMYGSFALRDGTQYMDMIYFLLLFSELTYLKNKKGIYFVKNYVIKWINFIFIITWIYMLIRLSGLTRYLLPKFVYSGQQSQINLFGNYIYIALWNSVFSFYCSYKFSKEPKGITKNKIFCLVQIFTTFAYLMLELSRVTILTIIVIFILFLILNRKSIRLYFLLLLILSLIAVFLIMFGFELKVEGHDLSIDYIVNVFKSMIGQGNLAGEADGVRLRLEWWSEIFEKTNDMRIFLFGQGFGVALTNFHGDNGNLVREPHCSFMSVFARLGLIGLIFWASLMVCLFVVSIKKIKTEYGFLMFTIIIFALMNSLVEPYFENSYAAIPFYGLIGSLYFIYYYNRKDLEYVKTYNKKNK